MGEIVIDMQEFNEVVTILEKGKQKLEEKEREVQKVSVKIAYEDSFFGGDEYKEVIDPDSEMDYSKFTLQKNPQFPEKMIQLEKYYGDGPYSDMAIIEPFVGQQPIIDTTETARVEEYKVQKTIVPDNEQVNDPGLPKDNFTSAVEAVQAPIVVEPQLSVNVPKQSETKKTASIKPIEPRIDVGIPFKSTP